MAKALTEAYDNGNGLIVDVPKGMDPENFRHNAQLSLTRILGCRVGLSSNRAKTQFQVWIKK